MKKIHFYKTSTKAACGRYVKQDFVTQDLMLVTCDKCRETLNQIEREKAFKLSTIAQFIIARVPMIEGYAVTNETFNAVSRLSDSIGGKIDDVLDSQEWEQIKKILDI